MSDGNEAGRLHAPEALSAAAAAVAYTAVDERTVCTLASKKHWKSSAQCGTVQEYLEIKSYCHNKDADYGHRQLAETSTTDFS